MGMNKDLKPGKGAHLVVNGSMLEFVYGALGDLYQAYDEAGGDLSYDANAKDCFAEMKDRLVNRSLIADLSGAEWVYAKDSFGEKLIAYTEYPDGECRITLVLTKKGELKLDIRPWIEY